jgi:hypothetical protein
MKKKEFLSALREFKKDTQGAACFRDPRKNINFCANGLTQQQANNFARQNRLTLQEWHPGN